jgi:hypothetical protein
MHGLFHSVHTSPVTSFPFVSLFTPRILFHAPSDTPRVRMHDTPMHDTSFKPQHSAGMLCLRAHITPVASSPHPVCYTFSCKIYTASFTQYIIDPPIMPSCRVTSSDASCMQCVRDTGNGKREFDPAQWLTPDHSKVTINRAAGNVSFGNGPRSCTGRNLADTELILIFVRSLASLPLSATQKLRNPLLFQEPKTSAKMMRIGASICGRWPARHVVLPASDNAFPKHHCIQHTAVEDATMAFFNCFGRATPPAQKQNSTNPLTSSVVVLSTNRPSSSPGSAFWSVSRGAPCITFAILLTL